MKIINKYTPQTYAMIGMSSLEYKRPVWGCSNQKSAPNIAAST